jgi:mono/diheme cytochrome c family protein
MKPLQNARRQLASNLSVSSYWKLRKIRLTISMLFCLVLFSIVLINSCSSFKNMHAASDGPAVLQKPEPQPLGNADRGKEVFRFETFGNEGFWFNAMRMQQGMDEAKVTPKQMLAMGLHFDMEALDAGLKKTLEAEFKTDLSIQNAPNLNDPKMTVMLINSNTVIGIVPKDSNKDQMINILKGDVVGISCTLCHAVTDASAFNMPNGGSAGKRIDGLAPLTLDMGKLLATAKNSRAYYANMQLNIMGKTIGRAPKGIEPTSTEAEVDAYLSNPAFYPVGTFDETHDGIGNSVKNVPLFRQDLAAPFGTSGQNALLENISNSSYTSNLDMTTLATPEGRQFLFLRAGDAGVKIHENYKQILQETGVTGYPYVQAKLVGGAGNPDHAVGRRVDDQKLKDMTAYLFSLPAPPGAKVNTEMAARGRALFRTNCTGCHNVDQNKPVDAKLLNLKSIWPDYNPANAGKRGDPNQSAILNSPGDFDDKMIIVDASDHGEPRGNALPLLLDLDRTTLFLHNGSVKSLDELLDPKRGKKSPHPFYIAYKKERADMIEFLRGLDTKYRK